MESISGKVILITGASSGIGKATAKCLAAQGAKVVLGARRVHLLDEIVADVSKSGGAALAVACDVTRRVDVEDFVQSAIQHFGRVDVMINNAGIMPLSRLDALKVDEWDAMIDVNLKGTLYGIAAVLPHFQRQGSGHIVNIASIAGHRAAPTAAVYCATKFGVRALTEALRQEVAPSIRTTIISPGAVTSELGSTITDPKIADNINELMKIAIPPGVIADAIHYAISQPVSIDVAEIIVRPSAHV